MTAGPAVPAPETHPYPVLSDPAPPPVMPLRLIGHIGSRLLLENERWMAAMARPDRLAPPPPPPLPERSANPWLATAGRHARGPLPDAQPDDEAPTILPGDVEPLRVPAYVGAPGATIPDLPAGGDPAAAVQQASNEALMRAGADPADLESLARPGDGRDAAEQVTAVMQRPADLGDQK